MKISNAAAALGRLGGKAKSPAKAAAAKANGAKGGWPKGRKRGSRKLRQQGQSDYQAGLPISNFSKRGRGEHQRAEYEIGWRNARDASRAHTAASSPHWPA